MEEFEPTTWAKISNETDFVVIAPNVIVELFKKESEASRKPVTDVYEKWCNTIIKKCGGEWAYVIMGRVKTMLTPNDDA